MGEKADYNKKVAEIERKIPDHDQCKYITAEVFNKLMSENVAVTLKPANLATKADIDDFGKKHRF